MNFLMVGIALVWGVAAGYLGLRVLDNAVGVCLSVHGLLISRWKRLASKASAGIIQADIILGLSARLALYALFCWALLQYGHSFVYRVLRFDYSGTGGLIFAVVALVVGLSRTPAAWKRLVIIWKITHEFDYAQRRKRTQILRR